MVYAYVTPFDKSNYRPKIQFGQDITFMHFFSGNESCQSQTPTFSRVSSSTFVDIFSREIKIVKNLKVQNIFTSFSPEKIYREFIAEFLDKN